jgi:hypothetical protein
MLPSNEAFRASYVCREIRGQQKEYVQWIIDLT